MPSRSTLIPDARQSFVLAIPLQTTPLRLGFATAAVRYHRPAADFQEPVAATLAGLELVGSGMGVGAVLAGETANFWIVVARRAAGLAFCRCFSRDCFASKSFAAVSAS